MPTVPCNFLHDHFVHFDHFRLSLVNMVNMVKHFFYFSKITFFLPGAPENFNFWGERKHMLPVNLAEWY